MQSTGDGGVKMGTTGQTLGVLLLSSLTFSFDGDAADNLSPLALRARKETLPVISMPQISAYQPSAVTRPDLVSRLSPGTRQMKESCEIGSPSACLKAAEALAAEKDVDGANRLYDLGCTKGDAATCTAYGRVLLERGAAVQAKAMLSRGCSLGDKAACEIKMPEAQAKSDVATPPSPKQQRDRVTKFKTACLTKRDTGACLLAGTGFLALNQSNAAVQMFQTGCTLGGAPSCTSLGKMAELRGKPDMALQLFEVACSAGDSEACEKSKASPRAGAAVARNAVEVTKR